ncbi:TonB-dependent receptor [Zunongwangia atlantica]|uniref:TonB-dependent receptor, plug n=1 Tax=Zunongwangia atlantica 22II14-10F7 TaxID=1185767 RepID=A0A1Y1SXZ2_9FLAO|nr:TonB-dependent receptor [Zunongwangia atlantica]ORL43629.1 TonB-dependent receptor, plug [Zunongwangia atlantica 22II14-10F7]
MYFKYFNSLLLTIFVICTIPAIAQENQSIKIHGTVKDENGVPIEGASISIAGTINGVITDQNGIYNLKTKLTGPQQIHVSFIGYKTHSESIILQKGNKYQHDIILEMGYNLSEVMLLGKNEIQEIEALAYNVDVIDASKLKNTSLDVAHALDRVSGIRMRESGGVGSRMNLSMNGFRGNQVKIFMDGIPMDNFGNAFQLNNIPINIAKRIEIYKGVVPVGLGADALGGAINIVTNTYEKDRLDLSYSYGSFNTHRTNVDMTKVFKNDVVVNINAFQNYSDNDYKVNVDVADVNTGAYTRDEEVRRFHNQYHNETFIGNIGVINKSYADRLLFGVTLGQVYNEIQTAQRLVRVFGQRHSRSTIIMPSLKYQKKDLFISGLEASINANYNFGKEQVIDTVNRRYDWYGNYKELGNGNVGGEQSYTHSKFQNNNGLINASFNYKINQYQKVSISNVFSSFDRKQENLLNPSENDYNPPRKSFKNVLGLGYQMEQNDWSATIFAKNYNQVNNFIQSYRDSDNDDLQEIERNNRINNFGWGIAGTYFINDKWQVKASYEKSYRLPTGNELFGDGNLTLEGNTNLKPESSHNYNLGIAYSLQLQHDHHFYIDGTLLYRDAKDFIRPRLNTNQVLQTMENLQNVTNFGGELQINYTHRNLLAGINLTYENLRNNTKYVGGTESLVYRDRIPNMPYFYGNGNLTYNFKDVIQTGNQLSVGYNLLYVHAFYRYWPSLGSGDTKYGIPEQLSHDLTATYTMNDFSFTLEIRNILDKNLYDNFSLQKPGRSFTGKVRYTF